MEVGEIGGTDDVDEVDAGVFVLDQQLGGLDLGDWDVLLELDHFDAAVCLDLDSGLCLGDGGRHGSTIACIGFSVCNDWIQDGRCTLSSRENRG